MKLREALVGLFTAVASAVASVAVVNRAIEDRKPRAPAGNAPPLTTVAQQQNQVQSQATSAAGFLPKKDQDQTRQRQEQVAQVEAHAHEPKPIPPGWGEPQSKEIPRPTYWPVVMSVGITFIFWGIVTSLIVSGVGIVLFGIALAGWIGDIRHENAHD